MPIKKKLANNEELVTDLMRFSPFGALSQAFIIYAVRTAAEEVSATKPNEVNMMGLNADAWVGVAKDIKQRCDDFYGS